MYQIFHPWHWLTYGQNASGVGLIVLIAYTVYTRRMMLLAQQTRRAELYPILVVQQTQVDANYLELLIVNVGNGALLNASRWGQQVSQTFTLGQTFLEKPPDIANDFAGTLVKDGTLTLNTSIDGSELYVLEVIDGADTIGGRHQFCFLRRFVGPGQYEHRVRMIHPVQFLPAHRRLMLKLWEWKSRVAKRFKRGTK